MDPNILERDTKLMEWHRAKEQLAYWKEKEMELRKQCVAMLVPEPIKNEGMNTVELGNGYSAKAGIKLNYKLNNDNKIVWAGLDKISALGNEGKFVAERLISWTPHLLLTEYRQLQENAADGSEFAKSVLKEVEAFLVITEGAPSLEIKEPKSK